MTTRFPPPLGHRGGGGGGGGSRPISPPSGIAGNRSNNMNNASSIRRQTAAAATPSSDFCLSLMPRDKIVRRTLHSWSVHYSLTTNKWVATISRPDSTTRSSSSSSNSSNNNLRHVQFMFDTERQARKFCWSYTPPKMSTSLHCQMCNPPTRQPNSSAAAAYCTRHCRNCGVTICESSSCSAKWGNRMVPKTYIPSTCHHLLSSSSSSSSSNSNSNNTSNTSGSMTYCTSNNNIAPTSRVVRVCKSCDWLSNAFCMALIQGRYQDALILHDTGNVNLRTCFADINKEAMFPIHCAVMGGSLELVKWLVDVQLVPIVGTCVTSSSSSSNNSATNHHHGGFGGFNVRHQQQQQQQQQLLQSVQTSASRTLLDLAMTGRPKVEILMYLIAEKGLRINDVKDPQLAPKTLETLMKSSLSGLMLVPPTVVGTNNNGGAAGGAVHVVMDNGNEQEDSVMSNTSNSIEDACNICFERQMDCVFIPCGHQVCCTECGQQVRSCPICKVKCSVLRIFRQ